MKTVKKVLFFLLLFLFVSACLAVWFRFRDDGFFDPSVSDSSITDSTDSADSSDSSSSGSDSSITDSTDSTDSSDSSSSGDDIGGAHNSWFDEAERFE